MKAPWNGVTVAPLALAAHPGRPGRTATVTRCSHRTEGLPSPHGRATVVRNTRRGGLQMLVSALAARTLSTVR